MRRARLDGGALTSSISAGAVTGIGIGTVASQSLAVALVVWFMCTAMTAAIVYLLVLTLEAGWCANRACRAALTAGAVLTGVMGLLLLSPVAFAVGLVVLGLGPAVRAGARTWWAVVVRGDGPSAAPRGDGPLAAPRGEAASCRPLEVTDVITEEDLWRAWDSSGRSLSGVSSPEARLRDAEFRAVLLDELDRRGRATPSDDGRS